MNSDHDEFRFYLRRLQRHPAYLRTKSTLRSVRQLLPNLWRRATHASRELPSVVIVGAGKAGTTQLYSYLLRHPRCFGGRVKEINYFSKLNDRPLAWYRAHFPLSRRVAKLGGICLEASPSYLPSAAGLCRMSRVLPRARIIVLLREPVARAFSQYQHEKTRRRESRTFAEVVRQAVAGEERPPQYVARGYYALQLKDLFEVYPREQVMIIDSADLFADTNAVCQRVFSFVGLDPIDIEPEKIYNRGHYRERIDPAAAELLREHYLPHDAALVQLLGHKFSWMRPAPTLRKIA